MTTRIGVLLFDGVEELDWAGPWEVLATWAQRWPDDDVEMLTIADAEGPISCAKGARVLADRTLDEAGPLDVLIYPGGMGTRQHLEDPGRIAWLREIADATPLVTSVCTGSLVLAAAGLLDGRPATTHWSSLEHLAELGTDIEVRPDDRFVDDGDIITAAGVSAGIDMALHIIARLQSPDRARDVKRYIQYDPRPPV